MTRLSSHVSNQQLAEYSAMADALLNSLIRKMKHV